MTYERKSLSRHQKKLKKKKKKKISFAAKGKNLFESLEKSHVLLEKKISFVSLEKD